ncbi:MAG TPA: vitamin K epoxide reductase family protein, partial [Candidatus Saccharimonadales bacterium]|nr:vitamin K epoxide reductase family protein [Candidatus Saccharimonadales bacterium]
MATPKPVVPEPKKRTLEKNLPWLLLIGGLIVTFAALMLSIETYNRLKNPSYQPVCNLNPILSCTSVADSRQAHIFGFPNYYLGLAGYGAVAAIGLAMLAGARFKRWFWRVVEVGLLFAFLFMSWLQFETLYRIGALCIFCMVLWVFTWPMFWYTTLYNLKKDHIKLAKKLGRVVGFAYRFHAEILTTWYLIIIALILKRF